MEEVTELQPVPDAHVPVMKLKFNGVSIDLLYARFGYLDVYACCTMWMSQAVWSLNGRRVALILKLVPNFEISSKAKVYGTNPHLEAARDILAHLNHSDDIFLASSIKTGTTWLKALCFSIIHGQKNVDVKVDEEEKEEDDPLVKNTPSSCVQTIENGVYITNPTPDLSGHEQGPYAIGKAYETFADGPYPFGPFHVHWLEYWEASLKKSTRYLFLRYEEIKRSKRTSEKTGFISRKAICE
ncbi:Nuclear poly(A) polymerase 4 [Camellia lanceoleosa]|uniref:Nuclear poly(A) polymerase 4 n=1 Tax=Camellia lanceoleosa TaxID=1840588 RepID=A0ACC0F1X7_9ERIC|nr:Nuclear poly(A) polymerase 4 [Camellia lanceoleosa]